MAFELPFDTALLRQVYVDGAWQEPHSSAVIDGHSPVDAAHVFTVAHANEADVDRAVDAAKRAFDRGPWPRMSHAERAEVLEKFAVILRQHAAVFSQVWTAQTGTLKGMADNSANYSIGAIDRNVALASTYPFKETFEGDGGFKAILREPVGVVAAIAPWNAPLATLLNKIAPALLAGCTVIMKPAPETPLEAYIVAYCADQAGFPAGVVNLLVADREVSDYLVRHADVDKVSFTGSVAAGKRIASVCADRLARVTLELGGKSAAIVCDDYDIAQAAKSLAGNMVMLSGQNCAALTRALVPAQQQDEFLGALKDELAAVKIGDPLEDGVRLGPLAMPR
ncbi:MAG: aldehyde dehydrogenase family protein, partial [Pseudomonadota bacterium]